MQLKPIITNFLAELPYRATKTEFPTGLTKLDEKAWLRRQTINFIAARTSQNKSTLALNCLAIPTAESGKSVALFTLEDRQERYAVRYLANKTSLVNYKISQNNLHEYELNTLYAHRDNLKELPLDIIEDVGYEVCEIEKYIIDCKVKPDMIIVDYLNRIKVRQGTSRLEATNKYINEFSNLTKKYNFCGVILCQINREAQGEGNKKEIPHPQLHHIKESGDIEQIADLIIFLHWKYKYTGDDIMDKNVIDVIISKNKDGSCGVLQCRIDPEYHRISNIDSKVGGVIPLDKDFKPIQEGLK